MNQSGTTVSENESRTVIVLEMLDYDVEILLVFRADPDLNLAVFHGEVMDPPPTIDILSESQHQSMH